MEARLAVGQNKPSMLTHTYFQVFLSASSSLIPNWNLLHFLILHFLFCFKAFYMLFLYKLSRLVYVEQLLRVRFHSVLQTMCVCATVLRMFVTDFNYTNSNRPWWLLGYINHVHVFEIISLLQEEQQK